MSKVRSRLALGLLVFAGLFLGVTAYAQTTVSLPLTTGASNKVDLGFFAAGTTLQLSASGQGDLVGSNFQVFADGSLAAAASAPYDFANAGSAYPTVSGFPAGDGLNHFAGGGANYDFSGSGWMFAGLQTTDTTDGLAIRAGAVVATFSAAPARADWFLIGTSRTFVVPTGGANLYVAVNDSVSPDNHGNYSLTYAAIPEVSTAGLIAGVTALLATRVRRRQRARSST